MTRNNRSQTGQELGRRTLSQVRRYRVWDCSSCGISGLNSKKCKQCPQCGNSKDKSDKEERSVTVVDANYEHTGADVTCQYCGTQNEARFSCRQCGAALDKKFEKQVENFTHATAVALPTRTVQIDDTGFRPDATDTPWLAGAATPVILEEPDVAKSPTTSSLHQATPEPLRPARNIEEKGARDPVRRSSPGDSHRRLVMFMVAAIAVVVIGVGLYVFKQLNTYTQTNATVSAVSWTYSLPREDYAARDHSYETEDDSWQPPGNAFGVSDRSVTIRYEPIYDNVWVPNTCTRTETTSYDDTDGTWVEQTDLVTYDCSEYERQQVGTEPIDGTAWTWKEMEWATTTPLTATGNSYVTYPTFVATSTLRQAGQPTTTFTIAFTYTDSEGETEQAKRSYPRPIWENTRIGQSYDGLIDAFDRLRAIEGLDPEFHELTK